jgi:hypothetical protein
MSATPEYDQDAMMQESISRIHEEWKELRQESSSGQKGWLTQIRNYYARLVQADPEAAIELLATREYAFDDLRKKGVKLSYANVEIRLSDVK